MKKNNNYPTLKEVFLREGDVVSLADFRAKKKEPQSRRSILMSTDGQMLISPDDLLYVILTTDEQGEALQDGDPEKAHELGAEFFEIGQGQAV